MTIHSVPTDSITAFVVGDTTPSVYAGNNFKTANTAPTTITTFDDGWVGHTITVVVDDDFTTFDFTGGNLVRSAGTDYIAVDGDILTGVYDGTDWHCAITPQEVISWDDMKFPFTLDKQGQASKPDYDFVNLGLLFPQNDDTEIVHIITQMKHRWRIGSSIYPHVHYVQDESQIPVFKLDYRWYDNGGDPTVGFTTVSSTGLMYTYTAGSIGQIAVFPAISGAAITDMSSMLEIKFYRDDNVVAGDILVKEFDIHVQYDSDGSRSEWSKW